MLNVDEQIRPGVFMQSGAMRATQEALRPSHGAYLGGALLRKMPQEEARFQELFQRLLLTHRP